MHNTLEQWQEAANDVLAINGHSFLALQHGLTRAQQDGRLPHTLSSEADQDLSAQQLFQILLNTYDESFVKAYLELRQHCLDCVFDAVLLFPARTLFEMATRKAARILCASDRPRRVSLVTDFTTLAFSGSLGYSRKEFLTLLQNVAEAPDLPKGYVLSLLQIIDAVEEDDKLLFDQLLIDLRRAEMTGLRKEEVVHEWLWSAPKDLMFSNVSHLVHGNPFSILGLEKRDLALWRFYAFILQSDFYLLKLAESQYPKIGRLVSPSQEKAYRTLQDSSEKVLKSIQ